MDVECICFTLLLKFYYLGIFQALDGTAILKLATHSASIPFIGLLIKKWIRLGQNLDHYIE